MRAIVSQRERVDTLVPPNLATTQGLCAAGATELKRIPRGVEVAGILSCSAAERNKMARFGRNDGGILIAAIGTLLRQNPHPFQQATVRL